MILTIQEDFMQTDFDVIIIGAGVSGSYLGYLLAKQGIDVLILEKDPVTKKDSGIVSEKITSFVKLKRNVVRSRIKKIRFVSPSGKYFYLRSEKPFAYVLYRDRFEKYVRRLAVKSGARIRYRECRGFKLLSNGVEVYADQIYQAKMIVGCDGANSIVRASLGIHPPKIFNGVINFGKFNDNLSEIEVHLNKFYSPHFFAWSIPHTGETGTITKGNPTDCMKYYNETVGFMPRKTHIHPIPIGFTRSFHRRALLLGDSCGQVKPVSGGGIIYSMICANHAARTIYEAVLTGIYSKSFLSKYEKRWKKELGR
jgi:geranylgeranyl reductase family protein